MMRWDFWLEKRVKKKCVSECSVYVSYKIKIFASAGGGWWGKATIPRRDRVKKKATAHRYYSYSPIILTCLGTWFWLITH
jgi:hypothetical protein